MEMVFADVSRFDVIHFHSDFLHFPLLRRDPCPSVTTLHGRLTHDLAPLLTEYRDVPLVSISADQQRPMPWANWQSTVHHGLPLDLYTFRERPGDYLAFLGRLSPEKRVDRAIEIARRTGFPLKIAAKIYPEEREYFRTVVEPLLEQSRAFVEFVGEVGGAAKDAFLGNARALLFPIDWPEPFGLVMIEAMACGTPVVAFRQGSVPEVIQDRLTGFVVRDVEESVSAVGRVADLSRRAIRRVFEDRFQVSHMASGYLEVYRRLTAGSAGVRTPSPARGTLPLPGSGAACPANNW
jgi:glycosyltransferase involved in cell wall biosynthesis